MLVMISIFFILAFTSLLIKTRYSKSKKENDEVTQSFWERELAANSVRKKDISNLPYIVVDLDRLPFNEATEDSSLIRYQDAVKRFANKKILNLSGMTNTDIKLTYGAPNLTYLIDCDTNFIEFSKALQQWGKYLYDSSNMGDAKILFEYAIQCRTDIAACYTLLGNIYFNEHNRDGIDHLIEVVDKISSPNKVSATNSLQQLLTNL